MALTKYKIGEFLKFIDERNTDGTVDGFSGININKEFMPTNADTEGLDKTKYKVVRENRFVFSGMQTGRDKCIRISLYDKKEPTLVSPAYTTFEILYTAIILPKYFFMIFLRSEMDRLGWFLSDSSVRANLDLDVFCNIEIELPSLEIQQKYVDIYNAMRSNQEAYEASLDDLKLTCDAYIERLLNSANKMPIKDLLEEVDVRNSDNSISNVQGININKEFMPTNANITKTDLTKYKIVSKNQFAYSAMQTGRDECIRIALFRKENSVIISPAYSVLQVKYNDILADWIILWFSRKESDRLGWFLSDSSVRASLELTTFYDIKIPVPSIEIQKSIVDIYNVYQERKQISEHLKAQIKDICPILIKGALEEGSKK